MGNRFRTRLHTVSKALAYRLGRSRSLGDSEPRGILVAHNLRLGDTLMLTPLLAKLRATHPQCEVSLLVAPPLLSLYAQRPFGVRALPFAPSDFGTIRALTREPGFDLAIVAGDNRYSWLAAAMGARRIVAHAQDVPWTVDLLVDEQHAIGSQPGAWGDLLANLVPGADPPAYARGDWQAPPAAHFERPTERYAVLHVGASSLLKLWKADRWMALAQELERRGMVVVWSAGRGEEELVRACDPEGRFRSYAGRLDPAQLWHLLAGASLLVALDTGVAHLGRVTWTPTIVLFGPGSAVVCGSGRYWRDTPWRSVTIDSFPCRDQTTLFRSHVEWVRHCVRTTAECSAPRCMEAITVDSVLEAIGGLSTPRMGG